MSESTHTVCFTCGLAIETPPRLNRLTNGNVCPACRDRVLHELPPALPATPARTGAHEEVEERVQAREADWHVRDEGHGDHAL